MEPLRQLQPHILRTMIIRTVRLRTTSPMLTLLKLEKVRVVFLFLPPVRVLALVLVRTAFIILHNEVVCFPVGAHLR